MIYIGTAGWSNPPTERVDRAAGASHLQHYAAQFNAVEINSSFYRTHRRETYERWRSSTPPGFRFSVKAPRSITHECGLKRCVAELSQFLDEVAGLGRKLQVILVQTPGSLAFDRRVARRFFHMLRAASPSRIACEPRHPSWFSADADVVLSELGVARVVADPARCPQATRVPEAGRLVYYRLHGSPQMYISAYTPEYLQHLGKDVRALRAGSKEVWVMFDNTARHAAWGNAVQLRRLVARPRKA